jgi:hypothetical protein
LRTRLPSAPAALARVFSSSSPSSATSGPTAGRRASYRSALWKPERGSRDAGAGGRCLREWGRCLGHGVQQGAGRGAGRFEGKGVRALGRRGAGETRASGGTESWPALRQAFAGGRVKGQQPGPARPPPHQRCRSRSTQTCARPCRRPRSALSAAAAGQSAPGRGRSSLGGAVIVGGGGGGLPVVEEALASRPSRAGR